MRKVQLFYDVVSPYSWLAFEVFSRFKNPWEIDFELCPFFLGGVMRDTDNRAPSMLPARAPYMLKDLMRQSEYYQIPMQIPSDFLTNTITAMRLLTVVKEKDPSNLESLSRAFWQRHYGEGQEISSPESLLACAANANISTNEAKNYLELTQDPYIKEKLKTTTANAVGKGAFGAPTIFVETADGEEMFFGSDRFHLVAAMLGKKWNGPKP